MGVAVRVDDVTVARVDLSGVGLIPGQLVWGGEVLNVGTVATGQTSTRVVTLSNAGDVALTDIDVGVSDASLDGVSVTDTCAGGLLPGAMCSVSVTFQPAVLGELTGALQASASGGTVAPLTLRGRAAAPSSRYSREDAPVVLTFGNVLVDEASDAQEILIANAGGVDSGPLETSLTGDGFELIADECGGMSRCPRGNMFDFGQVGAGDRAGRGPDLGDVNRPRRR